MASILAVLQIYLGTTYVRTVCQGILRLQLERLYCIYTTPAASLLFLRLIYDSSGLVAPQSWLRNLSGLGGVVHATAQIGRGSSFSS